MTDILLRREQKQLVVLTRDGKVWPRFGGSVTPSER